MSPCRVLFLYSSLGVGGAERQLALLVPRLNEHGIEPVVATLRIAGRNFEDLRDSGVTTVHAGMRSRTDVQGALRAYRLWRVAPDVVFTHSADAHVLGHSIAVRAKAPHVAAEHGGPGIRRRLHHSLASRLVAPRVARVVSVSRSQHPDLIRLGYHEETIRTIPNGLPEIAPERSATEVRNELGLADADFVAVLVAALRPEKRADRFVDALASANARNHRVRGVVVGDGPLLAYVRERAEASRGSVLVIGERADAPDLMAAADVVCLSSDVEGLPMTALEAMALARPVVATDVGGLREAVLPGSTGLLVPRDVGAFAQALLELAADPERCDAMGRRGYDRFQRLFTLDRMTAAYVDLLRDVASEPRRSRRSLRRRDDQGSSRASPGPES